MAPRHDLMPEVEFSAVKAEVDLLPDREPVLIQMGEEHESIECGPERAFALAALVVRMRSS